jgi:formamidopyrimidine-DNA glycosylase
MPELPEVETARRLAERTLAGKRIKRVTATVDGLVFDQAPPAAVEDALIGRTVIGTGRKGKYFWLLLDQPPHPVFHFGMSGHLLIYRAGEPPPRYCKLEIEVADGTVAAIADPRRLGRIRLAGDPEREPPVSLLGFDPLISLPTTFELHRRLSSRRGPLKAVLLDQSFSAGVGNWVADEVLYQASLSPLRPANQLSQDEARRLRAALRSVAKRSVAVDADADRFPRTWLFHCRWDKRIGYTPRGERLVRQRIGGRTTTWAPDRQH